MRKWNAVLTVAMIVLFLFHAIAGSMQMMGIHPEIREVNSVVVRVLAVVMAAHAIIGICLTARTIKACQMSGVSYFRANKRFWAGRISGLAILCFMVFHILLFLGHTEQGAYRLNTFDGFWFAMQIGLVLSIAVHMLTNVRPAVIALGRLSLREYIWDIIIILSVLLLFMGIGFFVYYLMWQ